MSFGVLTSAKEEVSLYLWIRGKRWKQFLDRQELPTRNSWNSSKIDQKRFIICLVFVTSNLSLALIPQNLTASDFHFVSAASFFLSFFLSFFRVCFSCSCCLHAREMAWLAKILSSLSSTHSFEAQDTRFVWRMKKKNY